MSIIQCEICGKVSNLSPTPLKWIIVGLLTDGNNGRECQHNVKYCFCSIECLDRWVQSQKETYYDNSYWQDTSWGLTLDLDTETIEERIREFEEILAHPPPEQCPPREKPPKPTAAKYKDTPTAKAPRRSIWIPPGSHS